MYRLFVVFISCVLLFCGTTLCSGEPEFVYDYVIVGAGASGCVVANRLAADPRRFSVLLIEAGGPSQRATGGTDYVASDYGRIEGRKAELQEPWTRYDVPIFWQTAIFPPTPTEFWNATANPPSALPLGSMVGKMIGGSMVHNGMVWIRATAESINKWNVTNWRYEDVLPYFKKSENVTGSSVAGDTTYHGLNGPIQISDPESLDPSAPIFVNACIAAGYPPNKDFNDATREGCGYKQYNIRRGVRDSTAVAYLVPALKSCNNLKLIKYAEVTKILFAPLSVKANGVQFVVNNLVTNVYATKEVILAGGAIMTPALLMLSGIGPRDQLTALGIRTISNLPNVGKNLRNHHTLGMQFEYPAETYPNGYNIWAFSQQYAVSQTGLFANPISLHAHAVVRSSPNSDEPDINIAINPGNGPKNVAVSILNTAAVVQGTVTLNSSNPRVPPVVSINPWSDTRDVDRMVNGIRIARRIMSLTPPGFFGREIVPGATMNNTVDLRSFVTRTGFLVAHWYGTAKMGNNGDTSAVTDNRLRVRGVKGLRIADVSVIPGIANGHMQANSVMIAERCSDFILADADSETYNVNVNNNKI